MLSSIITILIGGAVVSSFFIQWITEQESFWGRLTALGLIYLCGIAIFELMYWIVLVISPNPGLH
jgi:hypothetical protein